MSDRRTDVDTSRRRRLMIVNAARALGELAAAGKRRVLRRHRPAVDGGQPRPPPVRPAAGARLRVAVHRLEADTACRCRSATASWATPPTPSSACPRSSPTGCRPAASTSASSAAPSSTGSPTSTRPSSASYDAPAHAAAGRRRRARDRRVGGRGHGDHAPDAHGRSSIAATSARRWGSATARAIASGSACAAAGPQLVITDLGLLQPDPDTCELVHDRASHPGVTREQCTAGDRLAAAVRAPISATTVSADRLASSPRCGRARRRRA